MDDFTTPADLARTTGYDERTVRGKLRKIFPSHVLNSKWELSDEEAAIALAEIGRK